MKKTKVLSLILAIAIILPNFIGVPTLFTDLFKNLFTIPAEAWTPTSADWVGDKFGTTADDYAYTFAVVGDTQTLLWYDLIKGTNNLDTMYDWIINESNASVVMGLGDVSERNNGTRSDYVYNATTKKFDYTQTQEYQFNGTSKTNNEYLYAKSNIDKLAAANIPYTLVRGNHDKPASAIDNEYMFDKYFPYEEYSDNNYPNQVGRYDGKYEDGTMYNTYLKFEVGGVKYLVLNLDCGVSSNVEKAEDIFAWANRIVASNRDYNVIVTTHKYLESDDSRGGDTSLDGQQTYYGLYDGQTIWDKLVRKHENIFLVLSGHHKTYDIYRHQATGDKGNTVTELMIDPQRLDMPADYENNPDVAGHGPTGMVATLNFSKDGKYFDVKYYSTVRDEYFRSNNQIRMYIDKLGTATDYTTTSHTHIYSGDCDTECDLCLNTTRTVAKAHEYYNVCDPDCNVCGTTRNTTHKYTNAHDSKCDNNCGTVRTPPHSSLNSTCTICKNGRPTSSGLYYTVYDGEATITGYNGNPTNITIPESINGYPVTAIGLKAFEGKTTLKSVAFESATNVKIINAFAFSDCTALTTINVPDSVYYIGDSAFANCTMLTDINIPEGVNTIERQTFRECLALTSITVPDSVNMIRNHAFYNCSNVETLTLSANVVRIEHYAFCFDNKITEVALPVSLKAVGQSAFYCTGLTKVWYEGSTSNKSGISVVETVHTTNGTHNNYLLGATWKYNSCFKNTSTTSRPHTYTATCDKNCDYCGKETRTTTRNHSLTAWLDDVPATCVTSGTQYKECKNCHTLLLTQTVAPTGVHVYSDCNDTTCNVCGATREALVHVYSSNCDTTCDICGTVRDAVGHTFDNDCDTTCNNCGATRTVAGHVYDSSDVLDPDCNNCGAYRENGYYDAYFTYTDNGESITITGYTGAFTKLNIPSHINGKPVTGIGDKVFYYGSSNTTITELTLPNTLLSIGAQAFYNNRAITSIVIPNSVTTIGEQAFYNCRGLTSFTLGSGVTTIGKRAVEGRKLSSLSISGGNNAFFKVENGCLVDIANKLLIVGIQQETVIIPSGVETIGEYSLYGPGTATSILRKIIVSDGVKTIETGAFDATALGTLVLPKSVTTIGNALAANTPLHKNKVAQYELGNIYYEGTETEYAAITKGTSNNAISGANAPIHYNSCMATADYAHAYEWKVDVEATCGVAGVKHEECACGLTRNENTAIEATGKHSYGEWIIDAVAGKETTGLKHRVCTVCGDKEEKVIPQLLRFASRSLTLGSSIQVNFKVQKAVFDSYGYTDAYAVFEMEDRDGSIKRVVAEEYRSDVKANANKYYVFDFNGLAPDLMGNIISATLYAKNGGEDYVSETITYSVLQYCESMFGQSHATYAELHTLLVDMLNYGAATQKFTGYKINELVNAGLTEEQKSWGTKDEDLGGYTITKGFETKLEETPEFTWRSTGLALGDAITMTVDFRMADLTGIILEVKCGSETQKYDLSEVELEPHATEANRYKLKLDKLRVYQMREPVYFTAYKDGVVISDTYRYAVECYVAQNEAVTTKNLGALCIAMLKYGDSAYNFVF